MSTIEQCANITFCVFLNKTPSDTVQMLEETFDKVTMKKMQVFKWYKCFRGGRYKYGDLALQFGGISRIGTINYGLESHGTQALVGLRWRGPAATVNYRPVLLSERALQNNQPTNV
jgi:hypothetical protein